MDEKYVYDLVFFNTLSRLRMEGGISVKRDERHNPIGVPETCMHKFFILKNQKKWENSIEIYTNKENYINKDMSRCDYNPLSSSLNYCINKNVITILRWKW